MIFVFICESFLYECPKVEFFRIFVIFLDILTFLYCSSPGRTCSNGRFPHLTLNVGQAKIEQQQIHNLNCTTDNNIIEKTSYFEQEFILNSCWLNLKEMICIFIIINIS